MGSDKDNSELVTQLNNQGNSSTSKEEQLYLNNPMAHYNMNVLESIPRIWVGTKAHDSEDLPPEKRDKYDELLCIEFGKDNYIPSGISLIDDNNVRQGFSERIKPNPRVVPIPNDLPGLGALEVNEEFNPKHCLRLADKGKPRITKDSIFDVANGDRSNRLMDIATDNKRN